MSQRQFARAIAYILLRPVDSLPSSPSFSAVCLALADRAVRLVDRAREILVAVVFVRLPPLIWRPRFPHVERAIDLALGIRGAEQPRRLEQFTQRPFALARLEPQQRQL